MSPNIEPLSVDVVDRGRPVESDWTSLRVHAAWSQRPPRRAEQDARMPSGALERHGCFVHELRGHLGTATLALTLIPMDVGAAVPRAILERSLERLRVLIERSVSEVRTGSRPLRVEGVRLSELLTEIMADASIDAGKRSIRLQLDAGSRTVEIDVDRVEFSAAITNVLGNALKFTRAGSQVWLRASAAGERVVIEIEDECGGLPVGAREAMFLPFAQCGTNRDGLGLGLSISRHAIESSGGTILVRDRPARGCVVVIDMPQSLTAVRLLAQSIRHASLIAPGGQGGSLV